MSFSLTPVEGKNFVDRKELLNEILFDLKNKKSTTGYALYGKRRIGKTSILLEIHRILNSSRDIVPVYFSLWDMTDNKMSTFVKELTSEILDSYRDKISLMHKARNLLSTSLAIIKDTLQHAKINIKLKDTIEFLLTFDESKADYERLTENLFNLAEGLAEQTNTKCVLLIDEFPSILDLKNHEKIGEYVIRKIRTIHERQKHVSLYISGSVRKTMSIVALSPSSAFYRQLVVREIGPLKKEHIEELLNRNLPFKPNKFMVDKLYEFSGGIPFYVQFVGRILERRRDADIDQIIEEFLDQEGNILFKEEFESIGMKERRILISIAKGNNSPTEIADNTNDRQANVSKFLSYLEEKGYASKKERGHYIIDDPAFQKWLKKRFVN